MEARSNDLVQEVENGDVDGLLALAYVPDPWRSLAGMRSVLRNRRHAKDHSRHKCRQTDIIRSKVRHKVEVRHEVQSTS